jgi:hypothetical protein
MTAQHFRALADSLRHERPDTEGFLDPDRTLQAATRARVVRRTLTAVGLAPCPPVPRQKRGQPNA